MNIRVKTKRHDANGNKTRMLSRFLLEVTANLKRILLVLTFWCLVPLVVFSIYSLCRGNLESAFVSSIMFGIFSYVNYVMEEV